MRYLKFTQLMFVFICINLLASCATEVGEQHGASGGIIKILKGSALDFTAVSYEADDRCRVWKKEAYGLTKISNSGMYRTYSYQCITKE